MILKRENKTEYEISELEIVNQFLNSRLFKDYSRELIVRLAVFVGSKAPGGLNSTFKTADDFKAVFDLLNLQILLKKIKLLQPKLTTRPYKKKNLI